MQFQKGNFEQPWLYVGRNRAHYKRITALCFGTDPDTSLPRLLSVGEVRLMV